MKSDKQYSQRKAMFAIARASFRSITRSPSAVVFTLLFPLVFILVFGFLENRGTRLEIGIDDSVKNSPEAYPALSGIQSIHLTELKDIPEWQEKLKTGKIDAVVSLTTNGKELVFNVETSEAAVAHRAFLELVFENLVNNMNLKNLPADSRSASFVTTEIAGRAFTSIDFILPGQLGFSILSTGVFGTAFVFFNLRQTLVIKRFFTTPVKKPFILLGEAMSRLVFTLLGSGFIIAIGYFAFGFTLVHGLVTALTMLLLAAIGLVVFMGFGFIISGVARNESMIPPLANMITLPQFLLSGTFFPIEAFPSWLQPVCKLLPLTYLNDALRMVAFEGASFAAILWPMGVVLIWGVVVYGLAVRFFRWE